jgi:hypothetical protein
MLQSLSSKPPCRFAQAESWNDLTSALTYSPLNRGADQLVHTLPRSRFQPRGITGVKQLIYNNIIPELRNLLSFTGPSDRRGSGGPLNPEAKTFVKGQSKANVGDPNAPHNPSKTPDEGGTLGGDSDTTPSQPAADTFAELAPSQINYLEAAPKADVHRVLSAEDLAAGRLILFCYRRHSFRQRVTAWFAVRTIWAYYSRHRLRHKVAHTTTDDQIRKLHNEYKKDAEGIECPSLHAKGFRRRLLLGPLPHVAVYLRGLEQVNQRQKDANKKQLQKVRHEALERVQAEMNICRWALHQTHYGLLPIYE